MARLVWAPQRGPQHALIDCPFPEILFGGARGGGKTDAVLGKLALKAQDYGPGLNAIVFRREMPQADDMIERALEIFSPLGAEYGKVDRTFRFANGARIRFRPLESVQDAQKYQGQNLTDAAIEEAGNYPDPRPIDMIFGALRSKSGVPTQMILTANPGGPGHQWIKARFIDASPPRVPFRRKLPDGGVAKHRSVFIPSRVTDNQLLLERDPDYVDRLRLVGSAELVRAWLDGDWNVIAGAFFPELGPAHIIAPCQLPAHWLRFRAMDWGSASPFAVLWLAVSDGELPQFPRGALIVTREWYGASAPNVGLKLTAEQVAAGIVERDAGDVRPTWGVIDPAAFAMDGGPSIAERMAKAGVAWRPADNRRVGSRGAMGGWDQVRQRLRGDGHRPMLYVFDTCRDLIRTLAGLQHDDKRPEDVDTDGEDHAPDALRYGCMARPMVRDLPALETPRHPYMAADRPGLVAVSGMTFREIIERRERRRREYT